MSNRLVTLAMFPSTAEAAIARNVLEEGGVRAQLAQEAATWVFGGMIGSVTLLVHEGDVERAEQLLDEALGDPLPVEDEPLETEDEKPASDFAENPPDRSPPIDSPAWTCAHCGARVPQKERRCWSCGASRTGERNPYFVRGESTLAALPHRETPRGRVPDHVVDVIDRAWRAAWLGVVIFFVPLVNLYIEPHHIAQPPLVVIFLLPLVNLYSAWLLLSVADEVRHLTGRTRRRFYVAFLLDVLVLGTAIMLAVSMIRR